MAEEPKEILPLIKAGTFSGLASEDVHEFIHKYKTASVCNRWSEKTKIELFPTHLTSTPYKWYNLYRLDNKNIEWDTLEKDFIKAFSPVALINDLQTVLENRTQRDDESPTHFLYEIVHLCKRIDPDIPEGKIIEHVIQGIKPDICSEIIKMENRSLRELNENLTKIETQRLIKAKNQRRYQNSNKHISLLNSTPETVTYVDPEICNLNTEIRDLKETLNSLKLSSKDPFCGRDKQSNHIPHRSLSPHRRESSPHHRNGRYRDRQRYLTKSVNRPTTSFMAPHYCHICKKNNHSTDRCWYNSKTNLTKNKNPFPKRSSKHCSYCKRINHTIDQCLRRPTHPGAQNPKNV